LTRDELALIQPSYCPAADPLLPSDNMFLVLASIGMFGFISLPLALWHGVLALCRKRPHPLVFKSAIGVGAILSRDEILPGGLQPTSHLTLIRAILPIIKPYPSSLSLLTLCAFPVNILPE
jgi:hypothetical protein